MIYVMYLHYVIKLFINYLDKSLHLSFASSLKSAIIIVNGKECIIRIVKSVSWYFHSFKVNGYNQNVNSVF